MAEKKTRHPSPAQTTRNPTTSPRRATRHRRAKAFVGRGKATARGGSVEEEEEGRQEEKEEDGRGTRGGKTGGAEAIGGGEEEA